MPGRLLVASYKCFGTCFKGWSRVWNFKTSDFRVRAKQCFFLFFVRFLLYCFWFGGRGGGVCYCCCVWGCWWCRLVLLVGGKGIAEVLLVLVAGKARANRAAWRISFLGLIEDLGRTSRRSRCTAREDKRHDIKVVVKAQPC